MTDRERQSVWWCYEDHGHPIPSLAIPGKPGEPDTKKVVAEGRPDPSNTLRWLADNGYLSEETRHLYDGWGPRKTSKGVHRRYITEWEPIDQL